MKTSRSLSISARLLVLTALLSAAFTAPVLAQPFITTWKTDNPGPSLDNQITIPTFPGETYNYDVEWGDGTSDTGVTGDITHTYSGPGTYTVSITGTFPRIYFDVQLNPGTTDAEKIVTIEQWGAIAWTSMDGAFHHCENLAINATDAPDLSGVTSMRNMFFFAESLNSDLSNWDVSSVINMRGLFRGASTFDGDISNWDVSNVTDMTFMFADADAFTQDITGWDVSNVTDMRYMFKDNQTFNQAIGGWEVSNLTDMGGMFQGASAFNQDIGGWDVSNVTDMSSMFYSVGASAFNQDIGAWDVSLVESMDHMFHGASAFNQNLGGWDVSAVTNISYMFAGATAFNQDIGSWDVSSVTNMEGMFEGAMFNQDISGWNVSNVTNMGGLFSENPVFNQDIGGWNVSSVENMVSMFAHASSFNQDIGGWDVSNVNLIQAMFFEASAFNQDISGWDVSAVTDMYSMFYDADAFDQDIGGWDVSAVTTMLWMFYGADAFDQDLGEWDIHSVTNMEHMFDFSGLSTASYDATLIGWAGQPQPVGHDLGAEGITYCAGAVARQSLITDHAWTFDGDALAAGCEPSNPQNVAGWRLLSVPGSGLSVQDLADLNLVQGVTGSYPNADDNLFLGYNGPTSADYAPATATTDILTPGSGFLWYFFDDADFPGWVPPEFVDIEIFALPNDFGTAETGDFAFDLDTPATTGSDLPAYMLGNPFQQPLQLAGVSVAQGGTLQSNFFAWDPTAQSYTALTATDYVTAWQGFWAEVDADEASILFHFDDASVDPTQNPPFIGLRSDPSFALNLELRGTLDDGKPVADLANRVRFEEDAMLAWDRHDGSKFYPPLTMEGYALLSLEGIRKGDSFRQSVRSLPSDLGEAVTIPLAFLSGQSGDFTISAEAMNLPDGWNATLTDLKTGADTNLLEASYAFTGAADTTWQDRFEVTITPAGISGGAGEPAALRLSSPSPNPATASTALVLQVPEAQRVTARVYDARGRQVATAHDGMLEAGEEARIAIDASELAAGTYAIRVTGESFAETRRFTVVR